MKIDALVNVLTLRVKQLEHRILEERDIFQFKKKLKLQIKLFCLFFSANSKSFIKLTK